RESTGPASFPAARLPAGSLGGFCAMRMLVLGAGLQGSACAYDLLQQPGVERVTIADLKRDRLPAFLEPYVGTRLTLAQLDVADADSVKIYVGGLPQHPEPPLNYQIVYSLEGALDYYTTPSWVLRDGRPTRVDALSELERVTFPPPVGELEAFHTGGGISTLPWAYEGKVRT